MPILVPEYSTDEQDEFVRYCFVLAMREKLSYDLREAITNADPFADEVNGDEIHQILEVCTDYLLEKGIEQSSGEYNFTRDGYLNNYNIVTNVAQYKQSHLGYFIIFENRYSYYCANYSMEDAIEDTAAEAIKLAYPEELEVGETIEEAEHRMETSGLIRTESGWFDITGIQDNYDPVYLGYFIYLTEICNG